MIIQHLFSLGKKIILRSALIGGKPTEWLKREYWKCKAHSENAAQCCHIMQVMVTCDLLNDLFTSILQLYQYPHVPFWVSGYVTLLLP